MTSVPKCVRFVGQLTKYKRYQVHAVVGNKYYRVYDDEYNLVDIPKYLFLEEQLDRKPIEETNEV